MNLRSTEPADRKSELIPLSRAQYGMWLADNLPGGQAMNIAQYVEIEGPIDVEAFIEAVNVAGHESESLVVRVVEIDGVPYQFVDRGITYDESVLDVSGESDPFAAAMEWMRRDFETRAEDMSRDRLAETRLIRIAEDRYLWYARAHHLVIDGYGAFNVLIRLAEHYNALLEGRPPAPREADALRDIIEAEQAYRASSRFENDRQYWLGRIAGLPTPTSLSGRTARPSKVDRVSGLELPPQLSDLLDRFSGNLQASPAQVVVAAFAAFLARMTGGNDVVLSMPVSGRVTKGLRNAAAMLANMVPIRFTIDGTTTVEQLVRASVSELVSAMRHQLYRFEDLRRDSSALDTTANSFGPIVNILFFDSEIRLGSAVGRYRALTSGTLDDLQLNLYRSGVDAPLLIELHGNANLYGQDELDAHAHRFIAFLQRLIEAPVETALIAVPLVEPDEEARIVGELAGHDGATTTATLVDLLTRQAGVTPSAVAVTSEGTSLTYRELDERSNRFARTLIALGAGPDSLVAIAMPRDADLIIVTLAVLKSGAGYLPLDIAHPADRLEYVLNDADPIAVVTTGDMRELVPGDPGRVVLYHEVAGDEAATSVTHADRTSPLRPDNIAYVIYTSGSTGRPKGVAIAHRAVATYLVNACAEIGVRPDDVWMLFHSFAFDYSVWEIFGGLVSGGRLVVVDTPTARSPDDVVRLAVREKVTVFNQTPFAFQQFGAACRRYEDAGKPDGGLSLRLVILSGERLDPAVLADWYEHNPELPVLANSYGITETTVFVTYFGMTRSIATADAPSTIGPALPGLRTYVLDERLRPAPLGAWGEIYVAGTQLARGYLNGSSLTSTRFVASPFGRPGERLYRSGDVARWNHQGELEYRGRADQQVQLRGFRIELDEVRTALSAHSAVSAAVAIVHLPGTAAARIVAYVVPTDEDACAADTLRAYVATLLPEYMVPAVVVVVPELPLTVNGKVDYRALPQPVFDSSAAYVAPSSAVEEAIAAIFAEVLDRERIGVLDSFFELGGNSLTATNAAARIAELTGSAVSVRDLFNKPTAAELAAHIDLEHHHRELVLRAQPRVEPIPLSPAQNRMWLINQADPASTAYNIPLVVQLTGRLDVTALRMALMDVIDRHESLRTVYPDAKGEGRQVVLAAGHGVDLIPEKIDVTEIAHRIGELTSTGFDVRTSPPIRVALLESSERRRHVLVVVLHHICCDGSSLPPLAADIATAYEARSQGRIPDWQPLTVQYADYSIWCRGMLGDEDDPGSLAARQLRYWVTQLAGVPPLLELPADRPRPARQSMRGDIAESVIPAETFAAIQYLARTSNVTTFMVIHAALAVLLARLSGSGDITIGTPVAGRGERALESLVGMFVNTVPLRTEVRSDESFIEFLWRVKDIDVDAFANSDLPYERVVDEIDPRRSAAHAPLCQVYLVVENMDRPRLELSELTVEILDPGPQPAKVDVIVTVAENASAGGDVALRINYATDLFDRETVEELAARLNRVLDAVVSSPDLPVGRVNVLSEIEQAGLVPASGGPAVAPRVLAELLSVADPDAVAVVSGEHTMSYGQLDEQSNRLARQLIAWGVGPGDQVALAMARSVEFVVGMWAVTKAGAAFVPVDPRNPVDRVALMVADADVRVGLTVEASQDLLPDRVQRLVLDAPDAQAHIAARSSAAVTDADRLRSCHVSDVAYVLYTSGSTGAPKGVAVTHSGLANFAAEQGNRYRVDRSSRVLQLAAPGFDAVVLELLMAHANGAALVVSPPDVFAGRELAELIGKQRVSHAFVTPSVLATMSPAGLDSLRVLVAGGEAVPAEMVAVWAPGRQLFNGYGPTETTIMVAISDPLCAGDRVTIGGPIRGVEAVVLDAGLQPVPVGVSGQLYVSGSQLARGYLERPAATATTFVADPYGPPGARMYRTGDLTRWTSEKTLEYLGRADFQVKIRGQRIELGEIEAVLAAHTTVKAAVAVGAVTSGGSRLVAYVVPTNGAVDTAGLLGFAAQRLPSHMVPDTVMVVDTLPLSAVGKIDRLALPDPVFASATTEYVAPRDAAEQMVADVCAAVLGIERVGVFDSFFDLGGNSLSATRAAAQLSAAFGADVSLRTLFEAPTVAALAESIRSSDATGREPLGPQERPDRIPLSPAQTRMWFLNQFDTASPIYNVPMVVHTSGPLDVAAMHAAITDVIDRHESLRTIYPDSDSGPHQVIAPVETARPSLEPVPVPKSEVEARIAAEVTAGFDVTSEVPFRITLLRSAPDEHTLILVVHHISFDGSSLAPLAADLATAYQARVGHQSPQWTPLPVQYADYAVWQTQPARFRE
ncbi:amino acid adenylation domain-containing protein [Nocardia tengchongensis]|uniref:Amino acid adenylation domain-containing protein n=1 Tax=Nocardia tengchongensis TaxID=2055889 RepID=A0ABX8CL97_9NOCA|nr:non-ribosomal peptide synthetase [Nocardia tengchongensis]QVI20734.1 amino acid adenylation domain-containing protein [Nocardia tengchongensis]